MSRWLRLQRPPSTGNVDLDIWINQMTDALNSLPSFSISSTTNGPNSVVTGDPGTLLVDIGSSHSTFWVKLSGTTTSGWTTVGFGV